MRRPLALLLVLLLLAPLAEASTTRTETKVIYGGADRFNVAGRLVEPIGGPSCVEAAAQSVGQACFAVKAGEAELRLTHTELRALSNDHAVHVDFWSASGSRLRSYIAHHTSDTGTWHFVLPAGAAVVTVRPVLMYTCPMPCTTPPSDFTYFGSVRAVFS